MFGAQIFVELERARLTKQLASIKEAEGNVAEAADILQTLAVVGAMVHGRMCDTHSTRNRLSTSHWVCLADLQILRTVHGSSEVVVSGRGATAGFLNLQIVPSLFEPLNTSLAHRGGGPQS